MVQLHLPLVCGAVISLGLAGSWVPPPSRQNGVHKWVMGGLTIGLGLSVFPLEMCLRFSLFYKFVCLLSGVSFFGLYICGGYWFLVFRPVVSL